jgi:hypothetical protein
MIYLVLSAVTLALLYGVYRLVLSRTTLHRFNRTVLLSILVLSFILPAVRIDAFGDSSLLHVSSLVPEPTISGEKGDSPQLHDEVVEAMGVADMTEAAIPMETGAISSAVQTIETAARIMNISLLDVLTYIYMVGLALMLIRLFIGIIRVETLCRLGGRRLSDGSKLVILDGEFQPSSWRNTILMGRNDYETDSAAIIEHEQAHIRCRHSIDVLLSQIVCALQWFNPAAWMLKRSLTEVHEYEADATVLSCGYNERQYQVSLVQAALRRQVGLVTSNFADCSTKKRIKMMKRNQSSPFACLKALLLLPVVAVIIVFASACKSDAGKDASQNTQDQATVDVVKSEPYDTIAFLKKFGYGLNPEDLKIKQLNHFITIEADGSIWFNIAGRNNYERAYLSSLDRDFELAKSRSSVEVTNPEKVYVMYNKENHLDRCAEVIRQLQKSYSDENIIFVREPLCKTVPPPPGLTIDTEKDDYLIVMINSNNEIRMEGKWSPGEGIKANFSSQETISPQEISKLDGLIRAGIPEINEKNPGESTIIKGLKGCLQWDLTCSHRVVNEVEKILRRYVEPGYVLYQRPTLVVNSK